MKVSAFLSSFLAALAVAKPLDKRYRYTRSVTYTATNYVTSSTTVSSTTTPATYGGSGTSSSSTSLVVSNSVSTIKAISSSSVATIQAIPSSSSSSTKSSAASSTSKTTTSTTSQTFSTKTSAAASTSKTTTSTTSQTSSTKSSTTTTTSTTSSTSSSAAAVTSASSSYIQPILDQHNIHRVNHSAPDVIWNYTLAATAQKIAASCVYAHNTTADGGGYGQNIGAGAPPSSVPALITNLMYNDEMENFNGLYGQANPDMSNFGGWGHFSQIVWKSTTQIGCYTQQCSTLQNVGAGVQPYFTVCNYLPPGNFGGQYGVNVLPPLGNPVVIV